MRPIASLTVAAAALALSVAPAGAQTILGYKWDQKEKPGARDTRQLRVKAAEVASPEVVGGDPATNGGTVQVIVNGGTPSSQTITLPPGTRWKRKPSNPSDPLEGWKYRESLIFGSIVTPVSSLSIAKSSTGKFKLAMNLRARYVPLDVGVPNPGTYGGVVITIPDGPTYCTNFGGVAGGTIVRNDAFYFKVARPTAEGTCPSGTPVCGDGIVDAPFETCDVGNDAACPGLCGANGLACLCPYCGDGTIDPGESCDTQASLGSCSEGCSYACTCAVCGDGAIQAPVEECEDAPGLECYAGTCAPPGDPNQCRCPVCGDGQITQGEECEPDDDAACPGLCVPGTCMCPVCGNGEIEPGEECDTWDNCGGEATCLANCTCSVCGNGVFEPPSEQCDGGDDAACPDACTTDCTCP